MMKYYLAVNGQPQGPYTIEELMQIGISRDALVWNDTMPGWQKASMVPEILAAFNYAMPPTPPMPEQRPIEPQPRHICPKTWLAESILATIFCCLPFGIVGIVNAASVESRFNRGNYDGAEEASKSAGRWTKISFFCGIAYCAIYLIFAIISAILGTWIL